MRVRNHAQSRALELAAWIQAPQPQTRIPYYHMRHVELQTRIM